AIISSGSLLQSLPAAALRSCRMRARWFIREQGTNTSSSSSPGIWTCRQSGRQVRRKWGEKKKLLSLTLRSILAKPRALDALSLASWNSSLSDRLVSITDRLTYLISSETVLSSALSQNSSPLLCRPASRKSPVDLSSIPAISLRARRDRGSLPSGAN
uniref:Uncharacterized protein n=1 Tax=Oncorhynchus kisutch TaxID=8019 RepID=A0A8C7J773_ONCKI